MVNKFDYPDYRTLRGSELCEAIAGIPSMHFDSAEDASLYFARELDYVKGEAYDVQYPNFTALTCFPISTDIPEGAETFTYYSYDKVGMAKVISNYATDLPRVDAKGTPHTAFVRSLGDSYGYSVQDLRAARMAGKPLNSTLAETARRQIDQLTNQIAWMGDKENNLMGVLSEDNDIPLYTLSASSAKPESTKWADKTAVEILADINGMEAYVAKLTKDVERPDTLLVPSDTYFDISNRQLPGTGISVMKFILDNAPYLKSIKSAAELNDNSPETNPYASGGSPKGVALLYTNNKKKIAIEIAMPFFQYPAQARGLELIVPCESRMGGVSIYYPLSALIAVGV